jgi:hypothetical protein
MCVIGLYAPVWYVTAAPHALGDLAMATALCATFFPGTLFKVAGERVQGLTAALASALAASTKLSMLPLGLMVTTIAFARLRTGRRGNVLWMIALWSMTNGILLLWTFCQSGSPFGSATAKLFHSKFYFPTVLADLDTYRRINQWGLVPAFKMIVFSLNLGFILCFLVGLAYSISKKGIMWLLACLVMFQVMLIALFLPHEFRFLGGIQYALAVGAAVFVAPQWAIIRDKRYLSIGLIVVTGPWLLAEIYYLVPFIKVDLGMFSSMQFIGERVALIDDFRALDSLLPKTSVILITNIRAPSVYAPRPVIYHAADWNRQSPLYTLELITPSPGTSSISFPGEKLVCNKEVYRNKNAVVVTYRTPGRQSLRGEVVANRCEVISPK